MTTSNTHATIANEQSNHEKETTSHQTSDDRRTLFVSSLRSNITLGDIRRYFTGSTRVIIKRHRTTPQFKYAFVFHRTSEEAERNLRRSEDDCFLGPQSCVEYARSRSSFSNNQQNFGKNKVEVSKIPENVSETDLRHLFDDCNVLKYYPARIVHQAAETTQTKRSSRISSG
ncbi:unnamed protein product [Adineta steineri]|uniref:RRM domain-containing protein n=1 Tax=Adineta steineri TaxID=433720 RepID=A0A814JZY8_9BILA|nr:unnamed protein product [Adineta steineri]CAF1052460.1 unnamed protein product [Adineta steineri]CAF1119718.1 unnamed protein product [Adineta steineri]